MKSISLLVLFLSALFCAPQLFAQQPQRVLDTQNMREGENVEYCITHKKHTALLQNPSYVQGLQIAEAEYAEVVKRGGAPKATIYTIPVVFHVLHFGGVENISDEQILNALFILNRDYRKQNADTANVHPDFQGMPADIEVEFKLATIAPNGQCFSGITRTFSPMSYQGDDGGNQVDAIVAGNNVYNGQWPGNKYLNIFICGDIGGAAGYTYKPSNWGATSMQNGIWILHDYVGAIGTGSVGASRALTHEVGHWLNLDHTWGGNNNPGNTTSCPGNGDNVQDTPTCIGVTACLLNSNTCSNDNAYWGFDIRDNVENYMDYSYCSKMYTEGQRTRMRNALQVSSTGRANVVSAANLLAVGASSTPYLCKADFSADKTTICLGDQVQFQDESYNAVATWSWVITPSTGWSFTNGTSASSENPTISFTSPGMYDIQLTASDGTISDAETKTAFIRVLGAPASIPYWEGFESYTTLNNLPNWEVYNANNNNTFVLEPNFGHSGSKCARLNNFGQAASNIDELTSSNIDLSGIDTTTGSVTLSFRYAYRKRTTSDYEYLKVFITGNCGENWAQRKTLGGNQLSNQVSSSAWAPSSQADWVTIHMTNVTNNYFTDHFRMRFKFEGEGGNNFFLDDINLYSGAPSNDLIIGITDQQFTDLNLYPNPTDGDIHVQFTAQVGGAAQMRITDISGKNIAQYPLQVQVGANLVITDTKQLASGSYLMILEINGESTIRPFVVK
ncbi:MAG: M43 family zinc metalloprotease [Flavobacteriia bacterium]